MNIETYRNLFFGVTLGLNLISYLMYYMSYKYYRTAGLFFAVLIMLGIQVGVIYALLNIHPTIDDNTPVSDAVSLAGATIQSFVVIALVGIIAFFILRHYNASSFKSIAIPFVSVTSIYGSYLINYVIQNNKK